MQKNTAFIKLALPVLFVVPMIVLSNHPAHEVFAQLNPIQNNVSVSAIVPPREADFDITFQSTDGKTSVPQQEVLSYEITYGAQSAVGIDTANTIVVDYSDDIAPGGSHVLEYVIGSASNSYGGVQPVIDLLNKTITWTIPALPAGTTNQSLTFQLRTTENYTGTSPVNFTTKTTLSNPYITLPEQTITQTYVFDQALVTPTPTPTSTPTPTPTLGPTALPPTDIPTTKTPQQQPTPTGVSPTSALPSPTVQPQRPAIQINAIFFQTITHTSATIGVTTNKPTSGYITYGMNPKTLTQRENLDDRSNTGLFTLSNLKPDTNYYFTITRIDESGASITSEIYTFKTAAAPVIASVSADAFLIQSGRTILASSVLEQGKASSAFTMLPAQTDYMITYTFGEAPGQTSLEILVRSESGIDRRVTMTQTDERTFTAKLRTGTVGSYSIGLFQSDEKGNVIGKKISDLQVTSFFSILELDTLLPVADARIFLTKYNSTTTSYEALTDVDFKNPFFTDRTGFAPFILAPGEYKATINAFGYKGQTVSFSIGNKQGGGYPTVHLEPDMLNIPALLENVYNLLIDSTSAILAQIKTISSSMRTFTTAAVTTTASFVSLGFMFFSIRTDIRWSDVLPFFFFHIAALQGKHKDMYLFGEIVDKAGKPISNARLEFVHIKSGISLGHTVSNKSGGFRIENTFDVPYVKLVVTKDDMPQIAMIVPTDIHKAIRVQMTAHHTAQAVTGARHILSGFFEIILIGSLLLELLFIESFGVARTLPFIALTFFNLALWIFYQREHSVHKVR